MKSRPSGLIAMILCVALTIVLVGCSAGPDDTVEQFFKDLNAGRGQALEALLENSPDQGNQLQLSTRAYLLKDAHDGDTTMIGAACSAAREKGGYRVEIIDVSAQGDSAMVRVRLELDWSYPAWETDFELIKREGEWRIVRVPFTFVLTGMSLRLYNDFDTRVLVGLPQNYSY